MLEDFKQEFGENFDTCNVFRLGDIILYKDPNVTLQYCVSTQKWDNPNYATLIPKDIPLKMCQRKLYVFRNTYFGSYLNTYQSGDITTNDFNFLFPEYEFIIEQAIKLQIPFILKAFRSNCTAFIKNVNTTSLVKATEMSAKQMLIFQEKIMLAKEDLIYYFLRLNKIVPSFKGLGDDVFNLLCELAMNDKMSNQDLDFYKEKILDKPGSITKKLLKINDYVNSNFMEYHRLWTTLDQLGNMDTSEYPEFPKPDSIASKLEVMRVKIQNLENEELYKILNAKYFALMNTINKYIYTGSKYSIVAPGTVDELDIEGNVLHHCVGSYKQNIAEGKEIILFLRKNSDLKAPFYTIDLDTDGYIRQIHTKYNGNIKDDPEKEDLIEFLKEWGNVKSDIINQKSIKLNYGALCAKE